MTCGEGYKEERQNAVSPADTHWHGTWNQASLKSQLDLSDLPAAANRKTASHKLSVPKMAWLPPSPSDAWSSIHGQFMLTDLQTFPSTCSLSLKSPVRGSQSVVLRAKSVKITWKLVRNANFQALLQTYWIGNSGVGSGSLCFDKPSGRCWLAQNLRAFILGNHMAPLNHVTHPKEIRTRFFFKNLQNLKTFFQVNS